MKKFEKPELTIITFDDDDIITGSPTDIDEFGDDVP